MRVLATHSIRQFPFHFPSRASPCATRFRTSSSSFLPDHSPLLQARRQHYLYIFLNISNKMQRYTVFFITVNTLHVSGDFSAHHQELKNCTHSIGYMSSLLAATASGSSKCSTCFRRFLHPSSGAQKSTHSIEYLSSLLAATASVGELFHASGSSKQA